MPLFDDALDAIADGLVDAAGRIYLHTAAPTNNAPTNGRTTAGGGSYASGLATAASDWTAASNGDVENSNAFDFGTASADVGTVTHWSYYKGTDPIAFGTLPSTTIANGDSFSINANSLQLNGSDQLARHGPYGLDRGPPDFAL